MEQSWLSIALLGHEHVGKSTTLGHILEKVGILDEHSSHKIRREAKLAGKECLGYAWVLDTSKNEREAGHTQRVKAKQVRVASSARILQLLDCPGHVDFAKNTLVTVSQVDATLLIVDARPSEFDKGMSGQTREHALLAYALGIKQLVIGVNKMEAIHEPWSAQRFAEIKHSMTPFLRTCGFLQEHVVFVPYSAWTGEGIAEPPPVGWYQGPFLLEALEALKSRRHDAEAPLRIPVREVYEKDGSLIAVGRVEGGAVAAGHRVVVEPGSVECSVSRVELDGEEVAAAWSGQHVGLALESVDGESVARGAVICEAGASATKVATAFLAKVIMMDRIKPISPGFSAMVQCATATVPCCFQEFVATLDRKTGATLEQNPTALQSDEVCIIKLVPARAMCVDVFSHHSALGRVVIRDGRTTVAVGIVLRVETLPCAANPKRSPPKGHGGDLDVAA